MAAIERLKINKQKTFVDGISVFKLNHTNQVT
jgi:hypothetical protein